MLNSFRALSMLEGFSLAFLLLVAMPARYHFGAFDIIGVAGMTHGLLWLAYLVMSLLVSHLRGWSVGFWGLVMLASVIPFAFVFLDLRLRPQTVSAQA